MATRKTQEAEVTIKPPNFGIAEFHIIGESPYVQHKFGEKARKQMEEKQKAGSTAQSKRKREARDFDRDYEQATHFSSEGWPGIPAPQIRNALISSCRLVNFTMTRAKLAIFIEADGLDKDDGTPIIKIEGTREKHLGMARNETGVADIRSRPMWKEWSAKIRIRYDADQFTLADVSNLLMRAGMQVGIGEGRPDSKKSNGLGWGLFRIAEKQEEKAA